jgi:long-chain fatty acid transport protein
MGNQAFCLGGANGTGFGWHDVNVWKVGVDYQYNKELALRAGFSHTDNPIKGQDVTFNIVAPGVPQNHLSLGFTYKTRSGGELTMAYTHAFSNSVTAPSFFNNFAGGLPAGSETIKMYQNTIGIAYGWRM